MATDRFFIVPFDKDSGLQTNFKPFLIPDEAFAELTNAYVFRGRVRKRFGSRWLAESQLLTRFKILIGTTHAVTGVFSGTVRLNAITTLPIATPAIGQMFSVGTEVFTVNALGLPANMLISGTAALANFNTTTGAVNITSSLKAEPVYYYPALPVMGLQTYESADVNQEAIIGFDTRFAYQYSAALGWQRLATEVMPGTAEWNGSDSEFYWTCTWLAADGAGKIFFVTNFNKNEYRGMRTFDGTTWSRFLPCISAPTPTVTTPSYLFGARIIVPFKNRLVALNTWEGASIPLNYGARARYSQVGNTLPSAAVAVVGGVGIGITDPVTGNAAGTVAGGVYQTGQQFTIGSEIFLVIDTLGGVHAMSANGTGTGTYNITTGAFAFLNCEKNTQIYFYPGQNYEWREDIPGRGNAIDCSTTEKIVSVEFIKDRMIVFFERSTWELVYTGNQAYPFVWQQINTELGAESTFSIVPFDKVAIGVGNVGIHACNGSNVSRIDQKIPQTVFNIHNVDQGIYRVYGIRDYVVETIYWTFPDFTRSSTLPYPNRILIFNYETGTWAFNVDSITCFGYYQPFSGVTWDTSLVTWKDITSWDSGSLSAGFRHVVAGNQEGYTFTVEADCPTNAAVLQITDITVAANVCTITCINHNMQVGDYVYLQDIISSGNITLLNDNIFSITNATVDTFDVNYDLMTVIAGTYKGNGTISRVSEIHIKTKEFNFYANKGRNSYVSKVDFLVDKTDNGYIDLDYYISTSGDSMALSGTGSLVGSGVLETYPYPTVPFEAHTSRVWHPAYFQADGECVQIEFYMDEPTMRDTNVRTSDFQLHAMIFYVTPSSTRLQ